MNNIEVFLSKTPLFRKIDPETIKSFGLSPYKTIEYHKGEVVAMEGYDCTQIGVIVRGSIEVKKISPSGKSITITNLMSGDIFGEVIVFSDVATYPSTLTANESTQVVYLTNDELVTLCGKSTEFLKSLLGLFSNKILMLSKKLNLFSHQSIRQKIAHFLLTNYEQQHNVNIKLSGSKAQIAEELGMPRPSFSRELMILKEEGILDYDSKYIYINNLEALEDCLF